MSNAMQNRPHFHVWLEARTGRMIYRLARGFHTRQAARQWAKRHRPDRQTMVLQCTKQACRPRLD